MNGENLEGYETSKILLYCEARLGLIQSYILNFNGKRFDTVYVADIYIMKEKMQSFKWAMIDHFQLKVYVRVILERNQNILSAVTEDILGGEVFQLPQKILISTVTFKLSHSSFSFLFFHSLLPLSCSFSFLSFLHGWITR